MSCGSHGKPPPSADRPEIPLPVCGQAQHLIDAGQPPPGRVLAVFGHVNADVDRLGDQAPRWRRDHLLHQLADPIEHRSRRIGVDGGEAARVSRVPGLDQLEGGTGDDIFDGGPGADTLVCGSGSDLAEGVKRNGNRGTATGR